MDELSAYQTHERPSCVVWHSFWPFGGRSAWLFPIGDRVKEGKT